jgi:hypothetical protein
MIIVLAAVAAVTLGAQEPPQDAEGPISTNRGAGETAEALRLREAVAYANPLPRGAPTEDYPLVAWCDALVTGHADLGDTLVEPIEEDRELVRLARLEAQDFRTALQAARPRASAAQQRAAEAAAAEAAARWTPLLAQPDAAVRSQAFGLFFGLPGRCEHAARRIRTGVTTPPATPADVGLEDAPAS